MIAASEPVEYVPGGRDIIFNHPGYLITSQHLQSGASTPGGENILLKRFSEKETWKVRSNKLCGEEELYYSGRVAIHSKGNQASRVLEATYSCETDIKHALWCKFQTSIPDHLIKGVKEPEDEHSNSQSIECVCLLDSYTLKVFTENGEDYVSTLQFQVSAVWPTKYGIILEKSEVPVRDSRFLSFETSRLSSQNYSHLPVAFSLTHPLDEICPLLVKHGGISYMNESSQRIIFTSSEPSLAMVYDTRTGLHSVYKIRKALAEECQLVCGNNDTILSFFNHSATMSPLNAGSNLSNKGQHLSPFLLGVQNLQTSNTGLGLSNTPFGSRTTSYSNTSSGPSPSPQQQHSRSHSSMATISRCQSPTHSAAVSPLLGASQNSNIYHSRLQQIAVTNTSQTHSPFVSFNSVQLKDIPNGSKPLYPEVCLEHVWTENAGTSKDIAFGRASKVFLTSDLVGQSYLGYLIASRSQLFLVRLEKTNKQQQVIFGMTTSIVAKDAVCLPDLHMIATVDLSNGITLYTGMTCVGKLHISGVLSNFGTSNYFLSNSNNKLASPFPRRSSLISQNCASHDIKFEEALHLLSPVSNCGRPPMLLENSLLETNFFTLKETVGNEITVESGNKQYFRITLPVSSTSPLVTKCLHTLRNVLQKDLAMQLLVKWYGARNAPGPQNFSPTQEWDLFLVVLFTLLGYDVEKLRSIRNNEKDQCAERNSPMVVPKKQKTNNCGSADDWLYLMNSNEHKTSQICNTLKNQKKSSANALDEMIQNSIDESIPSNVIGKINTQSVLFPHLPLVLFSLHLLYEEIKLNSVMSESLPLLGQLLYQLSIDLKLEMYVHHYFLDSPSLSELRTSKSQISDADLQKITIPSYVPHKPPNVFETLDNMLNGIDVATFPYLSHVNPGTRNVIYLAAMIANENRVDVIEMERYIKLVVPPGSRIDRQESAINLDREIFKKFEKPTTERIILSYHEMNMTKEDLDVLPPAISLMIRDVMHRCRECPSTNWPTRAYELIDRQDLAALDKHSKQSSRLKRIDGETKDYGIKDEQDDGMEFDNTILKLRFSKDHRVAEVRKLLNSSKPVRIAIVQGSNVSDHDFIEEQERHLQMLCTRTMALPVARGMFTLRTSTPMITEQLPIPRLCLTGKAPPRGTTVELTHIDVPPNMNLWPLFHNGVAAGLCIHPDAVNIDSTWIVYNKQQQGEYGVEHSGFLMALGLNGHLKNLAPLSTYEYLADCHEATSVGLLLGLSATHRGTMNVSMTKLLSLHVETLLPPTSIELNVQQNVQVAALMGVGLVYQRTAHRHISHALLSEIGRPPGPEMKNCVDRESYSLAAGLALGLVILGSGSATDLPVSIPDTLHYYMVGGHIRPFSGAQKDKYKSPSYQIREGDSINIDVTSPGATIALGLMYFNTGNRAVAEWMQPPDTQYLLEFVRPDFLLLRVLAKSLILWENIEPTKSWVSSHVPDIVYRYRLQRPTPEVMQHVDLETINQAYCNIIAGACMALGLRYAGTANKNAFKTLYNYTQMFLELSHKTVAELAGKSTVETCMNVVLLSAAVVMAGTGNLDIMRICRHIRTRVGQASGVVTYGSHLATHMALGLLFLGGGRYTLSNSPNAVAALIIALFPKFPTHSNDNRYHLQALRHLYVLAAEPRIILPKDIDTGHYCYATIRLTFENDKEAEGQEVALEAPCLLPQLNSLRRIELDDSRYWKIVFDKYYNWQQLENMLEKHESISIKQRAGCLSYLEDPHGFRSLVAQTLTTENAIAWGARPEYVTSFTNNKTVLNVVTYFLKWFKKDTSSNEVQSKMPQSERYLLHIFAIIVYECITKDKVSLVPLWLRMFQSVQVIEEQPNSFSMWQIKLLSSQISRKLNGAYDPNPLLSVDSMLAIKQKTSAVLDKWENDIKCSLVSYFNTGMVPGADTVSLARMCAYFIFYDIPYPIDQKAICKYLTREHVSHKKKKKNAVFLSRKFYIILTLMFVFFLFSASSLVATQDVAMYKLYKILQPL
ncbi:anaphase-promoting complex subunit 1 isoform X2 [Pseudomyrmex gracilis]|uniref:anaphase-promoting complex subunit 1 isoform X2 n=1 Tax=Pseudomyrmex gracilis TaxID=219809 RepID=UPI00099540C0|nr:anaphase-promoting complex subunit 1 isoform X2 [Pseudomyrmex gracilis]